MYREVTMIEVTLASLWSQTAASNRGGDTTTTSARIRVWRSSKRPSLLSGMTGGRSSAEPARAAKKEQENHLTNPPGAVLQ